MATAVLLATAGLQLALPLPNDLPPDTELAARRAREPSPPVVPEYPAVLSTPIFAPDRKPDASAVPVAGGMNGFMALGTAVAGDRAAALVRGPGGLIQRLKPGDEVQGWKLVAIETDRLTFERNNEHRVLIVPKLAPAASIGAARGQAGGQAGRQVNGQAGSSSKSDDDDDDDNDN